MNKPVQCLVVACALVGCSFAAPSSTGDAPDAGGDAAVSIDGGGNTGSEDAGVDDADAGELSGLDSGTEEAVPDAGADADADGGSGGSADGGSSVDPHEGEPCSAHAVTEAGDCLGTVSRWCDLETNTIAVLDCGAPAIGGTCVFEGNSTVNCAVPESSPCSTFLADGSFMLFACGEAGAIDPTLACDLSTGCTPSSATCVPAVESACTSDAQCTVNERCYIEAGEPVGYCVYRPQCHGDELVIDCTPGKQAQLWNCLEQGGSGCSGGACIGMPQGFLCDAEFRCEAGLTCTDGSCQ
jgi:hypothetical protein